MKQRSLILCVGLKVRYVTINLIVPTKPLYLNEFQIKPPRETEPIKSPPLEITAGYGK